MDGEKREKGSSVFLHEAKTASGSETRRYRRRNRLDLFYSENGEQWAE
jgi:hypothetical protein